MKLSVLIPVYNRAEALGHCLAALARQTLGREAFEVIVCDDGSDDAPDAVAAPFAGDLDLRVLRLPHRNRAAALNSGVHAARGDVVLFTDSDMVPTPTLLEKHVDFHRRDPRPEAALLGYMAWDPTLQITRFMRYIVEDTAWQFGYGKLTHGESATWGYFYGGNSSVKRSFVLAYGLHDEELSRVEDIELGYRLTQAGMVLTYDATAVNHHRHFVTLRDFARRNRAVGAALVRVARSHPELTNYLPVLLGPVMAREAERNGLTLDDVVARAESLEASLAEDQQGQQVWDFALWASLGEGVRDALRAELAAAPVRCTVIVPGGPADPPIPPGLSSSLVALEQQGFEFVLFRVGRDGTVLSPDACLESDILVACNAAAVRARGRHLCFVHRGDLDADRIIRLADAVERRGGLAVEVTGAARDAIAIARPFFFDCGGFEHADVDAAFGWRLSSKVSFLGQEVHREGGGRRPPAAEAFDPAAP